jgi:hypothetical protein
MNTNRDSLKEKGLSALSLRKICGEISSVRRRRLIWSQRRPETGATRQRPTHDLLAAFRKLCMRRGKDPI